MKTKYLYGTIIAIITFISFSCSKMNDLHQEYLDEGEIIYAAKVDSVAPHAGNKRIQLEMFIVSQRIEKLRIFWNDKNDSSDVEVANQVGTKTILLDNLMEKSYIFQLVSFDKFGNPSLPYEVTGKVYGPNFQSTLTNRVIKSKTPVVAGKTTITWSGTVDKGVRCDLTYVNLNDITVDRKVPMSELSTVITDFKSDMKYRTLFLPEPTAIDTFYTDYKSVVF